MPIAGNMTDMTAIRTIRPPLSVRHVQGSLMTAAEKVLYQDTDRRAEVMGIDAPYSDSLFAVQHMIDLGMIGHMARGRDHRQDSKARTGSRAEEIALSARRTDILEAEDVVQHGRIPVIKVKMIIMVIDQVPISEPIRRDSGDV